MQQIVQKLQQQGYITPAPDLGPDQAERARDTGDTGDRGATRFEITDKSLDFLGYRALRDLLGSIGKSSIGRHDTREMATGIEASGAPKPYEFGDTLNIDAAGDDTQRREREGQVQNFRLQPEVWASTSTTKT